jgi:hypothetical protein
MKITNLFTKPIFLCILLVFCRIVSAQQLPLSKYQSDNPDAKCESNLSKEIPGDVYCLEIKKGFFGSPTGERIESYYLNGLLDTVVHTHVKAAILPWWKAKTGMRAPNITSKGERKVTGDGSAAFYLFNTPPDSDTITFVFSQNTSYRKVLDGKLEIVDSDSTSTQDTGFVYKPKQVPVMDDSSWKSQNCNQPKAFDQLLGEKVVFIAKPKSLQRIGYSLYHWIGRESSPVSYDALVGKVGTIIEIQPRKTGLLNFRRVTIKLDSSGESVSTNALNDSISDVTLLSDIEEGRKRWVGKTLWNQSNHLYLSADAEPGEWKEAKKFQPVTVSAVMVGNTINGAINFVIQFKDGQEGLAILNLSSSNKDPKLLGTLKSVGRKECDFDDQFFVEDPRLTHEWPAAVWNAIEDNKVIVGMTLDQVVFVWGKPKEINTTKLEKSSSSQLVYRDNEFVYINEFGKVTAIQE